MFKEVGKMLGDLQIENDKLKQTLIEIKAIVEKAQWDYRMPKEVWDLILQKISECEVCNDMENN